ncbi:VOC family protein [Microbacterium sp. LWH3-1.2]|uniref:VOC family protein n=1 Tax=Microbacterium sp. LWH3-1.2 TaxID=3135256 RepID=UPI0034308DC8
MAPPPTAITTAFIPVHDPRASAHWYADAFGLGILEESDFSSVLAGSHGQVTLMGPKSGIHVEPGLPWATCNFRVDDLASVHERLTRLGAHPGDELGDPERCLFFTATDPDGNTILVTDR